MPLITCTPYSIPPAQGWSLTNLSLNTSQNFSGDMSSYITGIYFKSDGTLLYVVGVDILDELHEYSLSTPWDLSTASLNHAVDLTSEGSSSYGVHVVDSGSPDGTTVFVILESADNVQEYDLATPWDLSTESTGGAKDVSGQDITMRSLTFGSSGTKMYTGGLAGTEIYEYNVSPAWNASGSSYLQSFNIGAHDTQPLGVYFKEDGLKMFVTGNENNSVYEFTLSPAWDVTSASLVQSKSVAAQTTAPSGLYIKPDGTKLYHAGITGPVIYEYDLV